MHIRSGKKATAQDPAQPGDQSQPAQPAVTQDDLYGFDDEVDWDAPDDRPQAASPELDTLPDADAEVAGNQDAQQQGLASMGIDMLSGLPPVEKPKNTRMSGAELRAELKRRIAMFEGAKKAEESKKRPLGDTVTDEGLSAKSQKANPGQANEFVHNARLSPLSLLLLKQLPNRIFLDTRYRMTPAISAFPNEQFYNNQLKDDPSTVQEDPDGTKLKIRTLTKSKFTKQGVIGGGSEMCIFNIKYGVSYLEQNGTSLVNHANANSIVEFATNLVKEWEIKLSNIKILAYYKGQVNLLREYLDQNEALSREERHAIKVFTVDSFTGNESDIILLDFVVAKQKYLEDTGDSRVADGDAETVDKVIVNKHGSKNDYVTAHVRDPRRLCVALTRARYGLIIFCQVAFLENSIKKGRGKNTNAVALMIANAKTRKLVLDDKTYEDTSVQGMATQAKWDLTALQQAREAQDKHDDNFATRMQKHLTRIARYQDKDPK